jgi:hypothetical protein
MFRVRPHPWAWNERRRQGLNERNGPKDISVILCAGVLGPARSDNLDSDSARRFCTKDVNSSVRASLTSTFSVGFGSTWIKRVGFSCTQQWRNCGSIAGGKAIKYGFTLSPLVRANVSPRPEFAPVINQTLKTTWKLRFRCEKTME